MIGYRAKAAVLVSVAIIAAAVATQPLPTVGGTRPDVIVVMVDDLGAIDERVLERLPTIKALWLDQGLRYDQYFDETPLCCPARAQFLAGQHLRTTGVDRNDARLFDPSYTLATALRSAGYTTVIAGKYLNLTNLLADKTPPGWDHTAIYEGGYPNPLRWWVDGERRVKDWYTTDAIAARAGSWIAGAPKTRPLFALLTPFAPHDPSTPAPRHVNDPRCADIAPWKPPSYDLPNQPDGYPLTKICESLLAVDEMVARIQTAEAGRSRPAVWVFTSDNGMAWGAHGCGQKSCPSATQVPLYIAGPGIQPGSTDALISNIDLGPALARVGGARMPNRDGQPFDLARPNGDADMLEVSAAEPLAFPEQMTWAALRAPPWRLIRWGDGRLQLFDDSADPWELDDLADDPAQQERRSAMEQRLDELLTP